MSNLCIGTCLLEPNVATPLSDNKPIHVDVKPLTSVQPQMIGLKASSFNFYICSGFPFTSNKSGSAISDDKYQLHSPLNKISQVSGEKHRPSGSH